MLEGWTYSEEINKRILEKGEQDYEIERKEKETAEAPRCIKIKKKLRKIRKDFADYMEFIVTCILFTIVWIVIEIVTFPWWLPKSIRSQYLKFKEWRQNGYKKPIVGNGPYPKNFTVEPLRCGENNLPFVFSRSYFIYVETEYNEPLNRYIRQHIDEIRQRSDERYFKFIYIPEIKNLTDKELALAFPYEKNLLTENAIQKIRQLTTADFTDAFIKATGIERDNLKCGFLRLARYCDSGGIHKKDIDYTKGMTFAYADFSNIQEDNFPGAFEDLFFHFVELTHEGLYCVVKVKYPQNAAQFSEKYGLSSDSADKLFEEEAEKMRLISDEIRERIEILRQGGYMELLLHTIGEDLIKQLANTPNTNKQLSRIRITDDIRILLTDLDNQEVKMPTLARTLYVFYLRHTEGVEFKQLSEYQNELCAIYRMASNRRDDAKLKATISRLVNPTENKVNECASRIKEGFTSIMDDYHAKKYYLTGKRVNYSRPNSYEKNRIDYFVDLLKKVELPRELVEYPECLLQLPMEKEPDKDLKIRQEQIYSHRLDQMESLMRKFLDKNSIKMQPQDYAPQELRNAIDDMLKLDPFNYLAHFYRGIICCNPKECKTSIQENTILLEHDEYIWNIAYINRAEAYLYAKEYENGLNDINNYFNSIQRDKNNDAEAQRIKRLLLLKRWF